MITRLNASSPFSLLGTGTVRTESLQASRLGGCGGPVVAGGERVCLRSVIAACGLLSCIKSRRTRATIAAMICPAHRSRRRAVRTHASGRRRLSSSHRSRQISQSRRLIPFAWCSAHSHGSGNCVFSYHAVGSVSLFRAAQLAATLRLKHAPFHAVSCSFVQFQHA